MRTVTAQRPSLEVAAVLALLAVTVAGAHFTRLPEFGLYEDDYFGIAPHLGSPLEGLRPALASAFRNWHQGRPLNHFLPPALSIIGSTLGGLRGVYLVAAAWLAFNGLLAWLVARRLLSRPAAVVVAVAYLLFPADGTRILLTHAAHVQGAMTFMLLGALLWLGGGWRRLASYPVAGLTLIAYELAFLPFVTLPLLAPVERRRLRSTWAAHLGGCAALVAAVAATRFAMAESYATEAAAHLGRSILRMTTSLYLGPATSAASLLRSAVKGVRTVDPLAAASALVVVVAFVAAIRAASSTAPRGGVPGAPAQPGWRRLLAAALVSWSFAYALTLVNYPPTQTTGRLTSTHVAAAWGAAMAVGALFEGAWRPGTRRGAAALAIVAAWMAGLVCYHHWLQRGYAEAWTQQRQFWTAVTSQAPELGPGWSVLVNGTPRQAPRAIRSNSWSDHLAIRLIHATGPEPAGPSFAHLGVERQVPLRRSGEQVLWRPEFWGGPELAIDPARLVLFEDERGRLRRVPELATPVGPLRSAAPVPAAPRTSWPDTPVSRLLFPERFVDR